MSKKHATWTTSRRLRDPRCRLAMVLRLDWKITPTSFNMDRFMVLPVSLIVGRQIGRPKFGISTPNRQHLVQLQRAGSRALGILCQPPKGGGIEEISVRPFLSRQTVSR